jgi:hypothetical protein
MVMVLEVKNLQKMKSMKTKKYKIQAAIFMLVSCIALLYACKDEETYPETRLFRPVLNTQLAASGNSITVDMGNMKKAVSYTLELSRDTFKTTDYTLQLDTNYVVINDQLLKGDPLFWNTLYQLRSVAHAEVAEFDSKVSNLGSVRTERFPTILKLPATYDVTDVAARVSWFVSGSKVTKLKVFAATDLKLATPLSQFDVSAEQQNSGESFASGLAPSTKYQIAIYSDNVLRGWTDYATLVADINPTAPGVIDVRANTSPTAVADAFATAPAGATILIKRGVTYNLPTANITKSITIRAAYGFGAQQAKLFTTGNWNIGAATFDYVRFIDVEIRGNDWTANYVFNPAVNNVSVNEILFENCKIVRLRGIMRIRNTNVVINNFKIINTLVDSLGGYGIFTADQAPVGNPSTTAKVNNIVLQNSTFNHLQAGITSRNSSLSILVDGCTISNAITTESTGAIFNYSGGTGNNDVTGGIKIQNTIIGPGWNQTATATNNIRGKSGLPNTGIEVVNSYKTGDFIFVATFEIGGLNSYTGKQTDLWIDPLTTDNFNFKDQTYVGKLTTGDPRWRVKL